ncbi:hypothetical protein [Vannielia sp. SX4]|uniref:hypothetical protein n=1 Tax=Vannielia sp. SX4 TaxID=3463852 RepID=UPI004059B153
MPLRSALTLLLFAAPVTAHDLSEHEDLPFLAADCAGYWRGVAAHQADDSDPMAADLGNLYLAAAKDLAPELSTDLDYVAQTSQTRARQMLKDAGQISGAARLVAEQEQTCQAVGLALPAKWGFH